MNLLLDTHILLWWLANHRNLSANVIKYITNNNIYISAVSVWEIIIKKSLGKLEAPNNIEEVIDANGFIHLPVIIAHTIEVGNLPYHHDDPFDRLLIAQTICEDLTFVTSDEKIQKYPIKIIRA